MIRRISAMLLAGVLTVRALMGGELPRIDTLDDVRRARQVCAGEFRLPDRFTNAVGMVMLLIPAARFTMGRSDDVVAPAHPVRITRPFYIAQTETTQQQYRSVQGKNPSYHVADGALNRPVEQVTFFEARHFCSRLGNREGRTYRLPTEAEWELAAGATVWSDAAATNAAWHLGNSADVSHAVAGRAPGPFGLYDATGNVWEWTLDVVGAYPTDEGLVDDPCNTWWGGKARRKSRMIRGGCYNVPPAMSLNWRRVHVFEQFTSAPFIGFRCVMEIEQHERRD